MPKCAATEVKICCKVGSVCRVWKRLVRWAKRALGVGCVASSGAEDGGDVDGDFRLGVLVDPEQTRIFNLP